MNNPKAESDMDCSDAEEQQVYVIVSEPDADETNNRNNDNHKLMGGTRFEPGSNNDTLDGGASDDNVDSNNNNTSDDKTSDDKNDTNAKNDTNNDNDHKNDSNTLGGNDKSQHINHNKNEDTLIGDTSVGNDKNETDDKDDNKTNDKNDGKNNDKTDNKKEETDNKNDGKFILDARTLRINVFDPRNYHYHNSCHQIWVWMQPIEAEMRRKKLVADEIKILEVQNHSYEAKKLGVKKLKKELKQKIKLAMYESTDDTHTLQSYRATLETYRMLLKTNGLKLEQLRFIQTYGETDDYRRQILFDILPGLREWNCKYNTECTICHKKMICGFGCIACDIELTYQYIKSHTLLNHPMVNANMNNEEDCNVKNDKINNKNNMKKRKKHKRKESGNNYNDSDDNSNDNNNKQKQRKRFQTTPGGNNVRNSYDSNVRNSDGGNYNNSDNSSNNKHKRFQATPGGNYVRNADGDNYNNSYNNKHNDNSNDNKSKRFQTTPGNFGANMNNNNNIIYRNEDEKQQTTNEIIYCSDPRWDKMQIPDDRIKPKYKGYNPFGDSCDSNDSNDSNECNKIVSGHSYEKRYKDMMEDLINAKYYLEGTKMINFTEKMIIPNIKHSVLNSNIYNELKKIYTAYGWSEDSNSDDLGRDQIKLLETTIRNTIEHNLIRNHCGRCFTYIRRKGFQPRYYDLLDNLECAYECFKCYADIGSTRMKERILFYGLQRFVVESMDGFVCGGTYPGVVNMYKIGNGFGGINSDAHQGMVFFNWPHIYSDLNYPAIGINCNVSYKLCVTINKKIRACHITSTDGGYCKHPKMDVYNHIFKLKQKMNNEDDSDDY